MKNGINIIGNVRCDTGLGELARSLLRCCEAIGIPFCLVNIPVKGINSYRDRLSASKEVAKPKYRLNVVCVEPIRHLCDLSFWRLALGAEKSVAYITWEFPTPALSLVQCSSFFDEMWVVSQFLQEGFSDACNCPVYKIPLCIAPTQRYVQKTSSDCLKSRRRKFTFVTAYHTYSLHERKNPTGAVRAFKQAFAAEDERVQLIVKVNGGTGGIDPKDMGLINREINGRKNIRVIAGSLSRRRLLSLMSNMDCLVSLHRAEGFGLMGAEAMYLGKPVIMTGWSGSREYADTGNCLLVDYRLERIGKRIYHYEPDYYWAEPNLEQAAYFMREVFHNERLRRELSFNGRKTIKEKFNSTVVGEMVLERFLSLLSN